MKCSFVTGPVLDLLTKTCRKIVDQILPTLTTSAKGVFAVDSEFDQIR